MPKLDAFTQAYVECALWASMDDDGTPLDKDFDPLDLDEGTLSEMIAECAAFQRDNAADLATGTPEQGGHDFWLTRNGHGAGFWDGAWRDDVGQRLTDAAHVWGAYNLMRGGDGRVYGG